MRRDRGGRGGVIINVASRAGTHIYSFLPTYSASKHAVVGFTTSLAMGPDQRNHGVRWCCLCPDAIQTSAASNKDLTSHPELAKQYVQKHGAMPISQVVQAVMKLIRDPDNNCAILEVSHEKGARYLRRQVVDRDDVSDVEVVDTY
ncbi:15-hydroxyprostaglandin dehydrogenase [NAD(+)]-like [Pomacea canaliculata]|uniref:15-hydroxyprostaglandin dehydrogenase [NAD(+)]-like n=1 Tax=Pomacea canaliculata TaxID=400727 RepID=UPI000D73F098|nr:15-hydroxyprostaglandin dehydrogenase [NAD(+)]-like [Pomacea canaliculata]